MTVAGAPMARPASASPWSVAWVAPAEDSPESLLEQAQRAYDEGRYLESGELAAGAYDALPLANRASPYGENAVFQATNAYREAWLRQGDPSALAAGVELLRRHVADYDERGRRKAPSTVRQELERMELLEMRCKHEPTASEAEIDPTDLPDAESPTAGGAMPARALRRGTAAAFAGDAVASVGAVLLSLYVFGYQPIEGPPDGDLEQVRSVGHLLPALPLGIGAGVVGGLGMHALVDGGDMPSERRRKLGIGLTVAGAASLLAGAVVLGAGAAFWPAPENGLSNVQRANWSVNLQGMGLATMLGSLGILGPGIGALATRRRR